jgi:two-component system phosphate regulon sensor histidine kinase PhoR
MSSSGSFRPNEKRPESGTHKRGDSGTFKTPDSGTFKVPALTPETLAIQDVVSRMYQTQDPTEILELLKNAGKSHTQARDAAVFLRGADGTFAGGAAELMPEATVVEYVVTQTRPITVPQADRWITVFPLRAPEAALGLLVLDVTGVAEDVVRLDLEPVSILCDQTAVLLQHAEAVKRSIGESTLLANILDSITNAIVTLDLDGRITRLNRNAMAMLELTPEAVGKPYADAFLPEVTRAVKELLGEIERMGFAMERPVTARLASSLELNIAVSLSILRDETFSPRGTIVVLRDMTASRELDRLRKLDTMKSEFVANVSHELKTPLTSIKAYTEALLDMSGEGQVKQFLKVIDEESDRLLFLINDLLNVSRIQSGKMKLNVERVPPGSIVEEIVGISKVQSDKHELVVEIAPELPLMWLDKEKLKEVMVNLISNGIKYSPKGGKVWVRMRLEGANLRVEVKDQGIGVSKENLPKLFEAFYRVDSSHTAEIPGTGLGLVIVKAIVEHHGGRVWIESELGQGTSVNFLLPVLRELNPAEMGRNLGSMAE